ncbi:MAG: 50S ribosomal protein L28 [Myxococcales bacterium]|nr:50S ribosomal protein L28 [Myxococcales bacterium]
MARCELTGKGPIVKNLVSHSNIKTKKWMKPNIHKRRLWSEAMGAYVTLNITTSAIRSIEHVGGFDKFILRQGDDVLSKRARQLKHRIRRATVPQA